MRDFNSMYKHVVYSAAGVSSVVAGVSATGASSSTAVATGAATSSTFFTTGTLRLSVRAFLSAPWRFATCASCSLLHCVNYTIAAASTNRPKPTPRNKCFRNKTPLKERIRRTVSVG